MGRPRYHITASSNWLNDPNGLIHHNGRYHLFYQYNPLAPVWGAPHWGHVSSTDLLTWTDHPVALEPSPSGPDQDGCWSGCTRIIDGRPSLFYTAVTGEDEQRIEAVCRADGSDDLLDWVVRPDPLIPGPPANHTTGYHRDPFLYRHEDRWRMLLGSGVDGPDGAAGAVLLYESDNLNHWRYLGILFQRPAGLGPIDTGPLWECPQLAHIGGYDVLIISVQLPDQPHPLRRVVYLTGTLSDTRFEPDHLGLVDHGNLFYAPAITTDGHGRTLMWGWIQEATPAPQRRADHAGALSLPRELGVQAGKLTVKPVSETLGLKNHDVVPGLPTSWAGPAEHNVPLPGPQYELALSLNGTSGVLEIQLDPHSRVPACRVIIDLDRRQINLVTNAPEPPIPPQTVPIGLTTTMRLLVDESIVELFIEGRTAATTRSYALNGREMTISTHGTTIAVEALQLHPITTDCLPGRHRI